MPSFRQIPSIDALIGRPSIAAAIARRGRARVVDALRAATRDCRDALSNGAVDAGPGEPDAGTGAWIETRALARLDADAVRTLRPVINATGVILHTNLGRAPLAAAALDHARAVASGYATLEYDLEAGARGHRHVHGERLLCTLTGAEAAVVVNNNAAAMLLVLAALATGREVIVSRGELVEIGGGFRVPDVLAQSGAALREVGTTNRTRSGDYAAAIGPRTAALLRVHPSNFRIDGFTERPDVAALAALAHRFDLPLIEDLGSGWLCLDDVAAPGVLDEPSIIASLRAGADLVAFSGDKLLGGPQAGIVVGRGALIAQMRAHPLMRALRADKVTYALLEATLLLWLDPARRPEIPAWRMLTRDARDLDRQAAGLASMLRRIDGLDVIVVDGESTTGGGSSPESRLPTRLVSVSVAASRQSAAALATRLRAADTPVIARIGDDRVLLDPRTFTSDDHDAIADAFAGAVQG
jgi:L-seryl-tRNA(Ser) seleniumtransferase